MVVVGRQRGVGTVAAAEGVPMGGFGSVATVPLFEARIGQLENCLGVSRKGEGDAQHQGEDFFHGVGCMFVFFDS